MAIEPESKAPSIGSIDLSFDVRGNRVRQIYQQLVTEPTELQDVLATANLLADQNGATRRSVRALVRKDLVQGPELASAVLELGYKIEAHIGIVGKFEDFHLTYFGNNDPDRSSRPDIVTAEREFISKLVQKAPKSVYDSLYKASTEGFHLERLSGNLDPADYKRLRVMYEQSFKDYPYDISTSIVKLVQNAESHVYAARSKQDGELYSVAATELMIISIEGDKLAIREMGDSAKYCFDQEGAPITKGNGLNGPLKLKLIADSLYDTDLVFTESRAAGMPVNIVNHGIGMRHYGFLTKHTRIASDIEQFPETKEEGEENKVFGNMNVWALNKAEIEGIASEVKKFYDS